MQHYFTEAVEHQLRKGVKQPSFGVFWRPNKFQQPRCNKGAVLILLIFLLSFNAALRAQPPTPQPVSQSRAAKQERLTGVYRIDIPASDRLYSVVAGASSKLPFGEQQRFFIDLAVRLTPPDLIAIEQQGTRVSLGSSRAPRMTFVADGITRATRAADGHVIRVRFSFENAGGNHRLVFTSSGRTDDNFSITFESFDNGRQLRVVRRIAAESLEQPLVIRTVYNKISDTASWELYGEPQVAAASASLPAASSNISPASEAMKSTPEALRPAAADLLRQSLNEWIEATNKRDIDKQMSFYATRLNRFYLKRDAPAAFVREEKARVFATAGRIDISAEEPEIIFQDGGRTAIMRYRKKYRIDNGRLSRRGEVIQELRWQRSGNGWRIFSERDIRVL